MAACAGQPGKVCPKKAKKKEVLKCQGDLFLCEVCEYARFGDRSSRKPKSATTIHTRYEVTPAGNTEQKKASKTTEAGDDKTLQNATELATLSQRMTTWSSVIDVIHGSVYPAPCWNSAVYDLMTTNSRGIHCVTGVIQPTTWHRQMS